MWKKILNKKTIYIALFSLLYIICGFISLYHSISFFGLANENWMATMLAFAFEVGQSAVLFSLLTSKSNRSKFLPWLLMFIFTSVQVMGNVFSTYKYLMLNSADSLQYFKEPLFIWANMPDAQCNVILSYLIGGILPVSALALTSMITNFLEDETTEKIKEISKSPEITQEVIENNEPEELILGTNKELEEKVEEIKEEVPQNNRFVNL